MHAITCLLQDFIEADKEFNCVQMKIAEAVVAAEAAVNNEQQQQPTDNDVDDDDWPDEVDDVNVPSTSFLSQQQQLPSTPSKIYYTTREVRCVISPTA